MTDDTKPYRNIPFGHGACPVCDIVCELTDKHPGPATTNKWGVRCKQRLIPIHGPRTSPCPGSHMEPKPWLEASRLPTWDQMPDLDKGAALLHVWKRHREGGSYAVEHYPARYIENPLLTALDRRTACRHAAAVAGMWKEVQSRLGPDEVGRLYDMALEHPCSR